MRRIHLVALGVMALSPAAPARAQFVPEGLSPFQQVSAADLVVTGKVTDIEPEPVLVERVKGGEKVLHLVATLRVEEKLLGAGGLTHVRVAFVPELPEPTPDPAVPIFR